MSRFAGKPFPGARSALFASFFVLIYGSFIGAKSQQTTNSIWNSSTTPGTVDDLDSAAVELGLKFRATVAGAVTGVRFYKGPNNTGTHTGHLWTSTGSLLATATFANETQSGWQQATFPTPIAIQPNTTYVISYHCNNGHYSADQNALQSAVTNGPLQALQNGADGPNGVYVYGSTAFPTQSWNGSNYWVDLTFVPSSSPAPAKGFTISGNVSGPAAGVALSGNSTGSTTTDASGNYSFAGLASGMYTISPSRAGASFTPAQTTVSVNGADVGGVNFVAVASSHGVTLSWKASVSNNVVGYKVYRSTSAGGPFALSSAAPVSGTTYSDSNVSPGTTYYYVTTALDSNNLESSYSNQVVATVPTP